MIKIMFATLVTALMNSACLPPELEKYRHLNGRKNSDQVAFDLGSLAQENQASESLSKTSDLDQGELQSRVASRKVKAQDVSGIFALDPVTFRISAREEDVWEGILDILLRHYTLTVVDRNSGIISTEWDTFTRSKVVYRNKITLRVKRSGRHFVDLMIRNNLEYLRGGDESGGLWGGIWLPSESSYQETRRIVQNLALVLQLPPPAFPPEDGRNSPNLSSKNM